jgi:hypothetical protein
MKKPKPTGKERFTDTQYIIPLKPKTKPRKNDKPTKPAK